MFSSKLLQLAVNDPLPDQHPPPPAPIVVDEEEHWEVNNILNSRQYQGQLQYKVKWHGIDCDNQWYYADKGEFDGSGDVLEEYHRRYPNKPH